MVNENIQWTGIWTDKTTDMEQENESERRQLLTSSKKNDCLIWMSLLAGGFAHAMLASNLIFYVYINDIKERFHYNQTEVEVFGSMLNAGIGLGFLPNLIGKKLRFTWILVIGLVLSTIGILLLWSSSKTVTFYEDKSWLMAIYFLITGLGGSVAYIMSLRFNATHFTDDKRGRIIAMMFIFIDIGMISFTLVYYQAFSKAYRFEGLMIVILLFNIAVYIFCMIFLRRPTSNISEVSVDKTEHSANFEYGPIEESKSSMPEKSFLEIIRMLDYHLLAWMCSMTFAVSMLITNNMTVLTKEEGLSSFDSVITLTYPPLVIVSALTFSLISDKAKHILSRVSFLIMGAVCLGASSLLNAFLSTQAAIVILAVVLAAMGTGIVYTIGPTAMSEQFHIENLMRNWGLVMLVRAVLIIILHVIFGALYDMENVSDAMFCKGLYCTRYGYLLTCGIAVLSIVLGVCLIVRTNIKIRQFFKCLEKHD